MVQNSARRLQVWDLGDPGALPASGQESFVGTQPRAENEKALAVAWLRPIPCPDGLLAVAA